MQLEIKRIMTGKMGNDFRPYYEIYVDGNLVGGAQRKWVAESIGQAIVDGHIEATGDTTMTWMIWAGNLPRETNRELHARMDKLPDNYGNW